jgi:hypothetical protein
MRTDHRGAGRTLRHDAAMIGQGVRRQRCAIYTRVSTEHGLDMEFNSLDAQREACEAYITSQKHEGWQCLAGQYNDGGFSGGSLDRPDLQRLMTDIEANRLDIIVVYKVDRLTRSLGRLRQAGRAVRYPWRLVRLGHAELQHDQQHGTPDPQCLALVRTVRARSDWRAHQGQDRGLEEEGHPHGRANAAWIRVEGQEAGHRRGGSQDRPADLCGLS